MKIKLFFATICLFASFGIANGQVIQSITKSRTAWDNTGDSLHKIANEFSEAVGNALKANYPAKVQNFSIKVSLSWSKTNGYTLTYACNIERANAQIGNEDFQLHFDHRGGLAFSEKEAKANALGQLARAIPKLQEAYGNRLVCFYPGVCSAQGYYVYETFISTP